MKTIFKNNEGGRVPTKYKNITTNITEDQYREIKEHKLRINYLIGLGLMAHKNNPQLISRVVACEDKLSHYDIQLRIFKRHMERIDKELYIINKNH